VGGILRYLVFYLVNVLANETPDGSRSSWCIYIQTMGTVVITLVAAVETFIL